MTYREIVSAVASRMGHSGFDGKKADYIYAIRQAESEIIGSSELLRTTVEIPMVEDSMSYVLPSDYAEPKEIIVLNNENQPLEFEEVPYERWLKWDLEKGDTPIDTAELSNKIVLSLQYTDGGWVMYVKPYFVGKVCINYVRTPIVDPLDHPEESPKIPVQLHYFIVPGAVYYLSKIEETRSINRGDYNGAVLWGRIANDALIEFENRKKKVEEQSVTNSKWVVAKPYILWDNPKKYR